MIRLTGIKEVFNDYKHPSLLLSTISCDFKCEKEGLCSIGVCHNSHTKDMPIIHTPTKDIVSMFKNNEFVECLIIAGLEPMLQFDEIHKLISELRVISNSEVVIYTGYYPEEIKEYIEKLKQFSNIIIKFGRFVENAESKYDELLGVTLASSNQYAKRIEDL